MNSLLESLVNSIIFIILAYFIITIAH